MNNIPKRVIVLCLAPMFLIVCAISCGVKDSTIQESIAQAAKTMPDLSAITTTVKDGVVSLSGQVKDDAAKSACEDAVKAIKGVKSVENNLVVTPPPPAVVTPNPDDELRKGVVDATKDFPTVNAVVADGVVTLTGSLKKSSLPKLMQSLNSLNPKKIENKLTLK